MSGACLKRREKAGAAHGRGGDSLPVVLIVVATAPVRDAVTQDDERGCRAGRPRLDRRQEVPVLDAESGDRGGGKEIAALHPRRRAAARVPCDGGAALAVLRVQVDGEHGLWADVEVDRVGVGDLAGGDGHGPGAAVEREVHRRPVLDLADAGLPAQGQRQRGGGDGECGQPERIGYLQANPRRADRGAQCLAKRRVVEDRRVRCLHSTSGPDGRGFTRGVGAEPGPNIQMAPVVSCVARQAAAWPSRSPPSGNHRHRSTSPARTRRRSTARTPARAGVGRR